MELMACIKALKKIGNTDRQIEIYSDSAYVVNCFNEGWYKKWEKNGWRSSKNNPVKNKDLWKRLLKLVKRNDCTFVKVKGHAGNKWNEKADELAKKGIQTAKEKLESNKDKFEKSLNENRKLYSGRCWCDCEACDVHGNHCGNDLRGCHW